MSRSRNSIASIEQLAAQLRSPNAATKAAAVEKLCEMMEPLVKSLVRQYQQHVIGAENEDLEQVARTAVVAACKSFNRTKGAFPTHVKWWIRSALALYVGGLANPVRLPTNSAFRLPKMRRTVLRLAHELMREPTLKELSAAMETPETVLMHMLIYDNNPLRLDLSHQGSRTSHRGFNGVSYRAPLVESYPSAAPTPEEAVAAKEEWEQAGGVVPEKEE